MAASVELYKRKDKYGGVAAGYTEHVREHWNRVWKRNMCEEVSRNRDVQEEEEVEKRQAGWAGE